MEFLNNIAAQVFAIPQIASIIESNAILRIATKQYGGPLLGLTVMFIALVLVLLISQLGKKSKKPKPVREKKVKPQKAPRQKAKRAPTLLLISGKALKKRWLLLQQWPPRLSRHRHKRLWMKLALLPGLTIAQSRLTLRLLPLKQKCLHFQLMRIWRLH